MGVYVVFGSMLAMAARSCTLSLLLFFLGYFVIHVDGKCGVCKYCKHLEIEKAFIHVRRQMRSVNEAIE